MKGTTMTEYNNTNNADAPLADWEKELLLGADPVVTVQELREKVAELQLQRNSATAELEALRSAHRRLISGLQQDLESWAEENLEVGDSNHQELSELMVNNGLEGLKRKFKVTVQVRFEFEVEVEASDEDAARDEVDNELYTYIQDNVDYSDYSDYDIEAEEA
jgi:hypothetical protein